MTGGEIVHTDNDAIQLLENANELMKRQMENIRMTNEGFIVYINFLLVIYIHTCIFLIYLYRSNINLSYVYIDTHSEAQRSIETLQLEGALAEALQLELEMAEERESELERELEERDVEINGLTKELEEALLQLQAIEVDNVEMK